MGLAFRYFAWLNRAAHDVNNHPWFPDKDYYGEKGELIEYRTNFAFGEIIELLSFGNIFAAGNVVFRIWNYLDSHIGVKKS